MICMLGTWPAFAQDKPNIVYFLVDNLGYGELGAYGGGILRGAETPKLDAFAAEAARWPDEAYNRIRERCAGSCRGSKDTQCRA